MKMVRDTRRAGASLDDGDAFDLRSVGKIVGVGLNYRDHAAETGLPLPKEPTLFLKATSALCGPHDDVVIPRDSKGIDWEVELGVVIGAPGVYIAEARRARSRRRLYPRHRLLRARLPVQPRRSGLQGQELRQLRAARAVAGDARGDPRSAGPRPAPRRQRRREAERLDARHDLLRRGAGLLHQPLHEPAAGRRDPDRHARRRRPRAEAADLSQPGDVVTASIDGLGEQTHKVVAAR